MFIYPQNYNESKEQLFEEIDNLKKHKYHIFTSVLQISKEYSVDKIIIKSKSSLKNRIVFTLGLHGIEGYVGHCALMHFLRNQVSTIDEHTEIVIYHVLNPFGMINYKRTNPNNVDLNRNFSKDNFSSINEEYKLVDKLFHPKSLKSKSSANLGYYGNLLKNIKKHGVKTMNKAILYGQNSDKFGLYYSGTQLEKETNIIIQELPNIIDDIETCLWIDLHTGYGPRYQMSIINSQYEKERTKDLMDNLEFPLILGSEDEDIYDVDGDMIEYIYHYSKDKKVNLVALCFEYGTLGEGLRKTIESLKALTFENYVRYESTNQKINNYVLKLMKEQFMPSSEQWRIKAESDFENAMNELLNYLKINKKDN